MLGIGKPRKWRYTWETLAHIPTLRLFLFTHELKPLTQCKNLEVTLVLEQSVILVSWDEDEIGNENNGSSNFSLRVPVPRVLIDVSSPVESTLMEDHIEVKLVLLLPVNDPLFVNFDSILNMGEESNGSTPSCGLPPPLSVGSDIKLLSAIANVHFFCKNCSMKVTKRPLRSFIEMPSADWREVADNWFGTCCCSFGGISEKLVKQYANSYLFSEGACLLDASCVAISKDDLADAVLPTCFVQSKENDYVRDPVGEDDISESAVSTGSNGRESLLSESVKNLRCVSLEEERLTPESENCDDCNHCCSNTKNDASKNQRTFKDIDPLKNRESLLNVSLGNGFMVRHSNLSKDVDWIELKCPQCSSLLGGYPSNRDLLPVDGGVRLFKCYISTGLCHNEPDDTFRDYSLHRMFINQLMETAQDELSFRTVVRDLRTRCPVLQIVLLNSNAWSCTGYCLEMEDNVKNIPKVDLHPVAKVLFSDCSSNTEAQSRAVEEWSTKNQAEEVFMFRHQAEDLIEDLKSAMNSLPLSCSYMQGLCLSFIQL